MIEKDLFSHLSTQVGLVDGRVFPLIMPLNSLMPSIVYTIINNRDLIAVNKGKFGGEVRVQVDCYAKTYFEVKQLKEQVKQELYNFKYFPNSLNSRDLFEENAKLYREIIDFKIKV